MTRRNARIQGWVFPLFSPDSDDRLSPNFHRFVIWYRSCDTRSVGLGQYCLPKESNGFNKKKTFGKSVRLINARNEKFLRLLSCFTVSCSFYFFLVGWFDLRPGYRPQILPPLLSRTAPLAPPPFSFHPPPPRFPRAHLDPVRVSYQLQPSVGTSTLYDEANTSHPSMSPTWPLRQSPCEHQPGSERWGCCYHMNAGTTMPLPWKKNTPLRRDHCHVLRRGCLNGHSMSHLVWAKQERALGCWVRLKGRVYLW